MKKYILLFIGLTIFGCNNTKKTERKEKDTKTAKYVLADAKTQINFTAYKTTKKVGVKGSFKEIEITNNKQGNTIKDALNGAEFKIPVNSIETNNSSRNFKIMKFFFGAMQNTLTLTGKVNLVDETNGVVDFTMNGATEKLPFTYKIKDNTFYLKSTMDVNKWNGQNAISRLNEACESLHKGSDGISKTWNVVDIEITSEF